MLARLRCNRNCSCGHNFIGVLVCNLLFQSSSPTVSSSILILSPLLLFLLSAFRALSAELEIAARILADQFPIVSILSNYIFTHMFHHFLKTKNFDHHMGLQWCLTLDHNYYVYCVTAEKMVALLLYYYVLLLFCNK